MLHFLTHLENQAKKGIIVLIRRYQKILSPDHSFWGRYIFPNGYCKYHPTCSEYAKKALVDNNILIALIRIMKRLLQCNPWSKGGFDYPGKKQNNK